jgi:cytochrome c nitrite reductase small subunit
MSLKGIIFTLVIGVGIGVVVSLIGAEQIEKTGTPEFCISCHEMKPMYDTWLKGPHGPLGNKAGAVRASCTDCHLPHDSVVSYLTEKIRTAMKDAYYHNKKELISNVDFWLEKLDPKEVKKYTYESNCIHCHEELPDNILHEKYKKGEINDTCLDCHWYVGHGFYYEDYLRSYFKSKNENNTSLE